MKGSDKVKTTDRKLHNLRYWRTYLGLTQENVAILIGCKKSNYSQKENGNIEIMRNEMLLIQKEFNKKLNRLGGEPLTLDDIFLNKELRKVNAS